MSSWGKGGDVARASWWTVSERRFLVSTALLVMALGYSVGRWPLPTLVVFAALALFIGTIWSRGFALGAILVSSLVMLSITAWFGLPAQSGLLTKVLVGLFALTVLLDLGPRNPLHVPISMVMWVVVLAVSATFSASNRFLAFQAMAAYIMAPTAYVAIVHSSLSMKSLKRLALIVVAIVAAQAPIVFIQASFFTTNGDRMGGTFGTYGGTAFQAVVMGFAWTIAVALLYGRRRVWLVPVLLPIAAILVTTQTWGGFVFAALGTIGVGVARTVANPRRGVFVLLQYAVMSLAAVAVLYAGYAFVGTNLPGGTAGLTPSAITTYLYSHHGSAGQVDRLEGIRLVLNRSWTIADLLIGQGMGVLSSSPALLGRDAVSPSALNATFGWATSATRSLFETGLLGILLYLIAIGFAVGAVVKSWASCADELGVAVGAAAVGSAVIYVAAALYTTPWLSDAIAVLFWCLMGMAVKWGRLRSAELETTRLGAILNTAADSDTGVARPALAPPQPLPGPHGTAKPPCAENVRTLRLCDGDVNSLCD